MLYRQTAFALAITLIISGCAGTTTITPLDAADYDGRVVESLTLTDSSTVTFDRWETAGRGPDTRGRIRGDTVVGFVGGMPSKILLEHVLQLRLGVDDTLKGQASTFLWIILAVTVAFAVMFIATFDGFVGPH